MEVKLVLRDSGRDTRWWGTFAVCMWTSGTVLFDYTTQSRQMLEVECSPALNGLKILQFFGEKFKFKIQMENFIQAHICISIKKKNIYANVCTESSKNCAIEAKEKLFLQLASNNFLFSIKSIASHFVITKDFLACKCIILQGEMRGLAAFP